MNSLNSAINPVICVEAENEHFEICDAIISWMEQMKACLPNHWDSTMVAKNSDEILNNDNKSLGDRNGDKNLPGCSRIDISCYSSQIEDRKPDDKSNYSMTLRQCSQSLKDFLQPIRSSHHILSATGMGWNLARIFSESSGIKNDLIQLNTSQQRQQQQNQIYQQYRDDSKLLLLDCDIKTQNHQYNQPQGLQLHGDLQILQPTQVCDDNFVASNKEPTTTAITQNVKSNFNNSDFRAINCDDCHEVAADGDRNIILNCSNDDLTIVPRDSDETRTLSASIASININHSHGATTYQDASITLDGDHNQNVVIHDNDVSFANSIANSLVSSQQDDINNQAVRMRGNDEWAPPRAQIIFIIHDDQGFRKSMLKQKYRCAGCGQEIDVELARRLVLYCHYFGKYFCNCCSSHKSINLPGYILQKWDFHKYAVSYFALQLLDRISNEPLFNINDINASLYKKVKKLRNLIDIRLQLYYLKIYITTCTQLAGSLLEEFTSATNQHLLTDDIHVYSLNNLIEIQHGKLYEYLADLVSRSIEHVANCDRCRAKGHYCQLCGPSSLMSSMILQQGGNVDQQASLSSPIASPGISPTKQLLVQTSDQQHPLSSSKSSGSLKSHSRQTSGNYSSITIASSLAAAASMAVGASGPMSCMSTSGTSSAAHQQQQQLQQHANSSRDKRHELIFPFEIGRVAQCGACGCCYHQQCFVEAGLNCPKCERIQRRKAELQMVEREAQSCNVIVANDAIIVQQKASASDQIATTSTSRSSFNQENLDKKQ